MSLLSVMLWVVEGFLVFIASTLLFDLLHYFLHLWQKSRFSLLRKFSHWHDVHHEFLDTNMQINNGLARANLWAHLVPEYVTTMAGTALFLLVFPWPPVAAVFILHTHNFVSAVLQEGRDAHHMAMDRIHGPINMFWVGKSYHALHHVFPTRFFSSYSTFFDLIMGSTCQFKGRRFLVSGASGALGSALVEGIEARGGIVKTIKWQADYAVGDYARLDTRLRDADVLVLAHGAKTKNCKDANCTTFVDLIERFRDAGKNRLVPPEIWAVGSEAELHGDLGQPDMRDYAASKRSFAARARAYYDAPDLYYRHIVPSAFTSSMGKGPMSARTAAKIALFLISRGARYVPVTLTTLALWNYFRFRFAPLPKTTGPANLLPS